MISNIQNVKKAREMRLSGRSLSEISKVIDISKSTLSLWLRDIVLSEKQILELKERTSISAKRGRLNALVILKSNKVFRSKKIYDDAIREFPVLVKDSFFVCGLSLYLAKGSKVGNSFQFSSSNPSIIRIMKLWATKYLNIGLDSIKLSKYDSYSRITISGVNILRKVIAWQKLLIQYYDIVSGEV